MYGVIIGGIAGIFFAISFPAEALEIHEILSSTMQELEEVVRSIL